jgi:hypothetical protein
LLTDRDQIALAILEHIMKPPGPAPEVLKIEGDWKDAMRKLISKKRPVGGWAEAGEKQTVVKLHHAAALALVGWYLMVPPLGTDGMPDSKAPLSRWTIAVSGSYDTARACKERISDDLGALSNYALKHPEQSDDPHIKNVEQTRFSEQCIASDDPRLRDR